jgi:hypothetical protein
VAKVEKVAVAKEAEPVEKKPAKVKTETKKK